MIVHQNDLKLKFWKNVWTFTVSNRSWTKLLDPRGINICTINNHSPPPASLKERPWFLHGQLGLFWFDLKFICTFYLSFHPVHWNKVKPKTQIKTPVLLKMTLIISKNKILQKIHQKIHLLGRTKIVFLYTYTVV